MCVCVWFRWLAFLVDFWSIRMTTRGWQSGPGQSLVSPLKPPPSVHLTASAPITVISFHLLLCSNVRTHRHTYTHKNTQHAQGQRSTHLCRRFPLSTFPHQVRPLPPSAIPCDRRPLLPYMCKWSENITETWMQFSTKKENEELA